MILGKNKNMCVLPNFGEIQLEAFYRFINQGLMEEPENFPKIEDTDQEIEFQLLGEEYYLLEPLIKERDAVYESITNSCKLYVPAQLTQRKKRRIKKQTVFIGNIPLMNSQGTFVVNGIARVIINQMLRSPGIYYKSEKDSDLGGITTHTGTIISNWGERLQLELDVKNRIWFRINKKHKISILLLLLAMGLNKEKILDTVRYPEVMNYIFQETNDKQNNIELTENAISELYKQIFGIVGDVESLNISEELKEKFFEPKFELGKIGRFNINKKLNLNVPKDEIFSLPKDVIAAIDYSIELRTGIGTSDDIDHLKNKRIRSVADLLQNRFKLALERLEDLVRKRINRATRRKRVPTIKSLVTSSPLSRTFKEFFGSHPLSQFLDQTNPLTQIVHKRRLSSLGPGGLTKRIASIKARDIHPSNYGRICPIETSEGMNAGLISSLAIYASINNWGFLQSTFQKEHNQVSSEEQNENMVDVSAEEDEYLRIATEASLAVSPEESKNKEIFTLAQFRQDFLTTAWDRIKIRSILPLQYFSVGVCLIPFFEHNDANRALMGSNMQRQAVPLFEPERCIVGTGLEGQVASDSGSVAIAAQSGKINYIDSKEITSLVSKGETISTELITYQRSNNNTCIHQKPRVNLGEYLKKGQILADGAATEGGEPALGKNVLVAYMPWEGYNFEDAVLINERLIYENVFTSIHIDKYEVEARVTLHGPEILTNEIPHLDDYFLRHLDENGLVLPGSWVETGDVLVGKLTPRDPEESLKAPEGNSLQAIFGIDITATRETCLKVPPGGKGQVIDVRSIYPEDAHKYRNFIHVYILQKREIQVGDKVAGRHGNKGIISRILPREDMPYLQDGTPIDMILSPLGVPSRMNVGQIFECLLGLAGGFLKRHYRVIPFDERYEREASRKLVYSELHEASERTTNPWLFEIDNPGKSLLIDGRTGEIFKQPITIGKAYMLKLIHQVDDKIHVRSSGPYSLVTQQPLKGRSRMGGQRVGEMEVWALEAFGASYILQEMLTIKSDHIQARRKIINTIVAGELIDKPETTPESFRLLARELRCLALNLDHVVMEKDLIIDYKEL
uniref:DNA-directed RNA polymerase subunit beta n=1 Tax=Lycopodium clavatum TaxID=3252 RepID=A0A3T0IAN1_LYCCL|nr:RNA polymerase subunit beta [Lycopodium clavatum]AZU95749.1 RNA polymerase subunit beta [Lycopodium clavatum]